MTEQRRTILKIAATYIGTVIGAGFATGKEIVTFFTINGWYGSIGIIICTILFMYFGTKIMLLSHKIGSRSIHEFNSYIFGEKLGLVVNGIIGFGVLATTSVMLSGAGSIFEEYFQLPKLIGILLTIAFLFYIVTKGVHGVFGVNSIVVPILITFVLLANLFTFSTIIPNVTAHPPFANTTWFSILSNPLTYVALNMSLAQIVLVPLAYEIEDEEAIKKGGIVGGLGLGIILFLCHAVLLNLDNPHFYNIPIAVVIKGLQPTLHFLFLFIILGEIITTLVGNIYGLTKQIHSMTTLKSDLLATMFILVFCFLISTFDYGTLLSILYPTIGWLTFFIFPILALKK
ncbi:MAG: GerAB/ArcD/ProY family transporter [Bacillaceae bacterium]